MKTPLLCLVLVVLISSCSVSKPYVPSHRFSAEALQADYSIFRQSLETTHPGLWWYTPKDSMDYYFAIGQSKLTDSLTEPQFRNVLGYVISKMRCGHTSVRPSKAAAEYFDNRSPTFPLFIKAWPDTVLVTANLNRRDSLLTRGVLLQRIDGRPIQQVMDSLFSFLPADGYNTTHKYQSLSNGSFRTLYPQVFGLKPKTTVEFTDTLGRLQTAQLSWFNPRTDVPARTPSGPRPKPLSKKEIKRLTRLEQRSLRIDTAAGIAFMDVSTFVKGAGLRKFWRQSFRQIKKDSIKNLVVDLRVNGGGSVVLSNLLTKYIADKPFKVADSLYALQRGGPYAKYRSEQVGDWLFLHLFTKKRKDGFYHFAVYEGKYFKPKKKNHFTGDTYVLTSGNTFSAATLFARAVKPQASVTIVGEETGGGAYGNNAWLIPEVTLPHTGVRFRLPLFRLVTDKTEAKGFGVTPEAPALPSVQGMRGNRNFKVDKVLELIRQKAATQ